MSRFTRVLFPVVAVIVAAFSAGPASAQITRFVRADGPNGNGLSWATAIRRIQDAISVSQPGDSVWVAAGRYIPSSQGASIDLRNGVAVYGGFVGNETSLDQRDFTAHETVISGDFLGDDDIGGTTADNVAPILMTQPNVLATTILDGFTIRNSGMSGQAGALRSLGSPTIRNCTFTRNISTLAAAVFLGASGAPPSPRFINCRFFANGTFTSSTQGVFIVDGVGGLDARLVNCSFIGNSTQNAAIINVRNGSLTMVNCAVVQNTIQSAEAPVLGGQSGSTAFTMINSTIAGNRLLSGGPSAGLRLGTPGSALIRNCVLWGNTAPGVPVERAQFQVTAPSIRFDYCRIQGWTGVTMGTATSDTDPLFADLDGPDDLFGTGDENVRVLQGSSCIDAGNNFYVWPDITDLDNDGNTSEPTPFALSGSLRFIDDPATIDSGVGTPPIVDIGAYEFGTPVEPCRGDFNRDGFINSQDFFDFIVEFFRPCP